MKNRDRLAAYRSKRDFSKTPEPDDGAATSTKQQLHFVVQKHEARRLHYDFRLEWRGVLLSWAVTRGPSSDPREKRLAVRTEDHPLAYRRFEGSIPKGQYGGGTVMLWDQGYWLPLDDPAHGLARGKLRFRLEGQRLRGSWTLVRMRPSAKRDHENWLLIKGRDTHASNEPNQLTETFTNSIVSRRKMTQIASHTTSDGHAGLSQLANPTFTDFQLATLVNQIPEGDDWLFENKFDGYRCLASVGDKGCIFYSRSGKNWSEKFHRLCPGFTGLPCRNALIDGEVVAKNVSGKSAFSALQKALQNSGEIVFYAFDLLVLDGRDLTALPLSERKILLEKLLADRPEQGLLRLTAYLSSSGEKLLEQICRAGGEGLIAKRADSAYRSGRRKNWLKVKCVKRQEFVIGGFSISSKPARPFASLLAGEYQEGKLRYRGRVGSGFSDADLNSLAGKLKSLRRKTNPFHQLPDQVSRNAVWVKPQLVMEVTFSEFTSDGAIRHGVYLGLREDKPAAEVKAETALRNAGEQRAASTVAGIRITHPGRTLFPDPAISKLRVAEYYQTVGERLLAIAANRPITALRCPNGIGDDCFYQRHLGKGFPKQLKPVQIKESSGDKRRYFYFDDIPGLIAAAQMGIIEFHIWAAARSRLEHPDRLVFDLDPDPQLDFAVVTEAADFIRQCLREINLHSVAVLTGGKGVHVCVPLQPSAGWDVLKPFAKAFARLAEQYRPALFTAKAAKKLRKKKIYLDWLRNERGATAIAPYSLRARPGAPVAVPVRWEELRDCDCAAMFSLETVTPRLQQRCPYLQALRQPSTLDTSSIKAVETLLTH